MRSQFFKIYTLAIIIALGFYACKPDISVPSASKGTADFSRYIAIGNSLTSGFSDGALYKEGQMNAYPVLIAAQTREAGGGSFNVPYMPADGNGNDGSGDPKLSLVVVNGSLAPARVGPVSPLSDVSAQGPYNNIGVPGARAIDATVAQYSALNPFLKRFCQASGQSSILSEALRINPTFFTLWLGNNDVLGYATSGGTGNVPPNADPTHQNDISDTSLFRQSLEAVVATLVSKNAKGVIANIPDVTSIPYFTTIPYNGLQLTQGQADSLNALYNNGVPGLTNKNGVHFQAGVNSFVVLDKGMGATTINVPGFPPIPNPNARFIKAGELLLLPDLIAIQGGSGSKQPMSDDMFLSAQEVADIHNFTGYFNTIITGLAAKYNLGLVDINAYFKTIQPGILYNGVSMNTTFITGGIFSLDGIHPTPRGYALIANRFIKAINQQFGASLHAVVVTQYRGVLFP